LTALASRFNSPAGTADALYAARESYAALSQQINQDPALTSQDRTAQLQNLATKAVADLQSTFGAEAADTYARRSGWIEVLKSGKAFVVETKSGPPGVGVMTHDVTPVPPPGPVKK